MHRLYLISLFLLLLTQSDCQIFYDFEDGDLSAWSGEVNEVIINDDNRLQLQAPDGGTTFIYTEHELSDSMRWEVDLEMDFSPSGSNKLELWLVMDTPDPLSAIGYLLSIGQTGSDDAIQLIERSGASDLIILEGNMGAVSAAFLKKIVVIKDATDTWTLTVGDTDDIIAEEVHEASFAVDEWTGSNFYGLYCLYTSTRTDKFFFDNILISELQPDTTPPQLISREIAAPNKLILTFDEPLDPSSALVSNNYNISDKEIETVSFVNGTENVICIEVTEDWLSSEVSFLTINGVTDKSNNPVSVADLELILSESPEASEILINEILYDPVSGNSADYVELINGSDKFLSLDSLVIRRADGSGSEDMLTGNIILAPNEIVAITQDRDEIIRQYDPPIDARIEEQDIPNFVNGEGIVALINIKGNARIMIDSFEYNDDLHNTFLASDETEGISLERLSTTLETNDASNWYSASSASNFGTPGYENSQRQELGQLEDVVELQYKVFSPDGDGNKDVMLINYELDKPGYVGNLKIYNERGQNRKVISSNELLSTEGFLRWDGTLDDGSLGPIGVYIIYYDFFHPDGDRYSGKKVCVLAQILD